MPSVASETQSLIHRQLHQPRNPGGRNDGESPFEMLLDMGVEPPASPKAYAATSKDKPDAPAAADKPSRPESPRQAHDCDKPKETDAAASDDQPDEIASGDDSAPVESTGDESCCEAELEADAVEAIAALPEDPESETVEASPEDTPAAETPQVTPQPQAAPDALAAALPVADPTAIAPEADAETDLLAQAKAQPAPIEQPQDAPVVQPEDAPAPQTPKLAADPLTKDDDADDPAEGNEGKTVALKEGASDKPAKLAHDEIKPIDDKPKQHAPQGDTEKPGNGEPAQPEARTEAKPRAQHDVKPDPVQAPDQAAAPKADAAQTPTLTPAQIHASATGQLNAASATPVAQAVPLNGLAIEIAQHALAGKHRFEIRLDPPELGRIDVRLDVDRDGNVTSRLVIERADTYDLLRRDASTLERALQNAGLKTADNALEFSLRDQGFAQRDDERNAQRNAAQIVIPDADAPAVNPYGRTLGLGAGIDIRV